MIRRQMQDDHIGHAAVGRHVRKEILQCADPARRSAESHNQKLVSGAATFFLRSEEVVATIIVVRSSVTHIRPPFLGNANGRVEFAARSSATCRSAHSRSESGRLSASRVDTTLTAGPRRINGSGPSPSYIVPLVSDTP